MPGRQRRRRACPTDCQKRWCQSQAASGTGRGTWRGKRDVKRRTWIGKRDVKRRTRGTASERDEAISLPGTQTRRRYERTRQQRDHSFPVPVTQARSQPEHNTAPSHPAEGLPRPPTFPSQERGPVRRAGCVCERRADRSQHGAPNECFGQTWLHRELRDAFAEGRESLWCTFEGPDGGEEGDGCLDRLGRRGIDDGAAGEGTNSSLVAD